MSISVAHEASTINNSGNNDLQELCRQHMRENDFHYDGLIVTDGKWQRFPSNKQARDKDDWYVAFNGISNRGKTYLCVTYGSWKMSKGGQDKTYTFRSWIESKVFDESEKNSMEQTYKEHLKNVEEKHRKAGLEAAQKAHEVWGDAALKAPSAEYDQYPKVKGTKIYGVRFGKNPENYPSIIIDIRDVDGAIVSIQFISWNEKDKKSYKRFLDDGKLTGNFHIIDGRKITDAAHIFLTEGWSTGASVYEGCGEKDPVVVAGSVHSFASVIKSIRTKNANTKITIAADNDESGIKSAHDAAREYSNIEVVFPTFPEDKKFNPITVKKYKDFNDLHQACGIDEVRLQLSKSITIKAISEELKEVADSLLKRDDPLASFQLERFPKVLCDYIYSQCKKSNIVHPLAVTMSAIAEVSAYLGNHVYTDWYGETYSNIWVLIISQSGSGKSTALRLGSANSRKNQAEIFDQIKILSDKIRQSNSEDEKKDLERKTIELSIKNVILPEKSTAEALFSHLSQGHGGVIFSHELSSQLQNLNKSHNNDLKPILTALYEGSEPVENHTITRGRTIIKNAFISICGMSTIDWIKQIVTQTDIQSGFLPRFLMFVLPPKKEDPVLWPQQSMRGETIEMIAYNQAIDNIKTRIGNEKIYLPLSPEARDVLSNDITRQGIYWDILKIRDQYEGEMRRTIEIFIPRWLTNIVKNAISLQLLTNYNADSISAEAIRMAYPIILAAIQSTIPLLKEELGESKHEQECRKVYEWILNRIIKRPSSPVTRHDIQRSGAIRKPDDKNSGNPKHGDSDHYDRVLSTLVIRNELEVITKKDGKNLSKKDYEYHPIKESTK